MIFECIITNLAPKVQEGKRDNEGSVQGQVENVERITRFTKNSGALILSLLISNSS